MTAKELIGILQSTNGSVVHVPQSLAIQFLEECNKDKEPVNCTLIFDTNSHNCKTILADKILLDFPLNV